MGNVDAKGTQHKGSLHQFTYRTNTKIGTCHVVCPPKMLEQLHGQERQPG
eukprot:CAMPEP_0183315118 /NCGR_PEP_ID=MMETSP0160_2-20130417/50731_1 /TAXON_ID=2839 ORGANISM="Odontella Sinensis, Strain Grunow 1884" /NCGR_SAMPLE_ID=MMETSP0160_2 /ASSEMBLY_ACC=CAM_ASM_000250 /LENGTH=49 /DNA_ID= /DNA_START= /DNA_END= /DNA_ORIENTATION=